MGEAVQLQAKTNPNRAKNARAAGAKPAPPYRHRAVVPKVFPPHATPFARSNLAPKSCGQIQGPPS
jgi:hypothetical protein